MSAPNEADVELPRLLEAIHERRFHDFRSYARSSLGRRVETARATLGCPTLASLRERVVRDPAAWSTLLRFLTVQVSDMFRDPPYFLALRRIVAPRLATYPAIRVWVAGCSTGEELYSLAILLHEEGLLARSTLYATDIDPAALSAARAGTYAADRLAASDERYRSAGGKRSLSDYCTAARGKVTFDRSLVAHVVCEDHSLATDGVFAEVHLVSCRNVLIYFDRALQHRAVGLFRDALVRRGFLGLGRHESLRFSAHAAAFAVLAQQEQIYQRSP